MKFIDSTEIKVQAGRGGDGAVSFMRASGRPMLGPDGGNGGNGGNIVLEGTSSLNTLSSVRYRQFFEAESGGKGGSNNKTGKCGSDYVVRLPFGTIVFDSVSGKKLCEILPEGESVIVARGGKRGYGNLQFTNSTRQAPKFATKGQDGVERALRLELKVLADVGLAGAPNAGKSTLLSCLSNARPKIDSYPFTTIVPNIGVVDAYEGESFVLADVPGLIEGASEGRGLGLHFLRHLERTKAVVVVIDLHACLENDRDALSYYNEIAKELTAYSEDLAQKIAVILLNKCDTVDQVSIQNQMETLAAVGKKVLVVSGATQAGLKELRSELVAIVRCTV